VEDLLGTVDEIRAKRADLERQEQELTAALREKLREQEQRLRSHGITPEEDHPLPRPAGG
jgi:hypothetical protein